MSILPQRQDRSSAAYKKELYICTTIMLVLTLLGGGLLGMKISKAEAARENGEYERVLKERYGGKKPPPLRQGPPPTARN